jgi:chorismate mutase/prephenate dehydratase
VESSAEGVVSHTLDTFVSFLASGLMISAEIVIEVTHCVLVRPGVELTDVERVYAHPQALSQCRRWLVDNLPRAIPVEAASTADAARQANEDAHGAAVASELAARLFGLRVVRRDIADLSRNATRFLVIGREQAERTGHDKTSLLIAFEDKPGVLHELLGPLARGGVNMTRIESRPSRRGPAEQLFFIDVDGHRSDAAVAAAVDDLVRAGATVKVLGSYPKAENHSS